MFIQVKGSTTWSLVIRAEMFRFQSAILSDDGDDNDYGKQASNGWLRIKKRKKNKKTKRKETNISSSGENLSTKTNSDKSINLSKKKISQSSFLRVLC